MQTIKNCFTFSSSTSIFQTDYYECVYSALHAGRRLTARNNFQSFPLGSGVALSGLGCYAIKGIAAKKKWLSLFIILINALKLYCIETPVSPETLNLLPISTTQRRGFSKQYIDFYLTVIAALNV